MIRTPPQPGVNRGLPFFARREKKSRSWGKLWQAQVSEGLYVRRHCCCCCVHYYILRAQRKAAQNSANPCAWQKQPSPPSPAHIAHQHMHHIYVFNCIRNTDLRVCVIPDTWCAESRINICMHEYICAYIHVSILFKCSGGYKTHGVYEIPYDMLTL